MKVGEWNEETEWVRKEFPGPAGVDEILRVAYEREALAEVHGHAREFLDNEICGVLVGEVCQDSQGPFVWVKAAIRGAKAKEKRTEVAFTQETWEGIHKIKDERYPKLQIVGWYHSHPGFGVEFSEMDIFVQQNFFPAPTQIALVTDPLSGQLAMLVCRDKKPVYLERFWVDGREHQAKTPGGPSAGGGGGGHDPATAEKLKAVETRLNQVIATIDRQSTSLYRFQVIALGMLFSALAVGMAYNVWTASQKTYKPPTLNSYARIPVQVGDRTVWLGVQVVDWDVPPELNAAYIQAVERRLQLDFPPPQQSVPPTSESTPTASETPSETSTPAEVTPTETSTPIETATPEEH